MYQLVIARDGYTRPDAAGRTFPRWVLALSVDGTNPIRSKYNARRMAVVTRSSGIAAPLYMARAVAYVKAIGGCTAEQSGPIADWFRAHRTGQPVERIAA